MSSHRYEKVRNLNSSQILWKVSPPITFNAPANGEPLSFALDMERKDFDTSYVVTSAAVVPWGGPETYIFPANEEGEILGWSELPGSYRGGLDHEEAIKNVGSYDKWD